MFPEMVTSSNLKDSKTSKILESRGSTFTIKSLNSDWYQLSKSFISCLQFTLEEILATLASLDLKGKNIVS